MYGRETLYYVKRAKRIADTLPLAIICGASAILASLTLANGIRLAQNSVISIILLSLSLSQVLTYNSLYITIKARAPALIYGFSCKQAREAA